MEHRVHCITELLHMNSTEIEMIRNIRICSSAVREANHHKIK